MVVSSGYVQPKNRVPGSSKAMSCQAGSSSTSSCDLEHNLNKVGGQENGRTEGEQEYATAEVEVEVSPDDAPELFCDEEV